MKTLFYIAIATWSLVSAAAAQAVPEIRTTPTEVVRGDKGDNQIGSSKLAGVHTKVLSGNPAGRRLLLNIIVRARAHDHSGAFSSR